MFITHSKLYYGDDTAELLRIVYSNLQQSIFVNRTTLRQFAHKNTA